MPSKTAHQPYFDDWPILMFVYPLLDMAILYHLIQRLNTINQRQNNKEYKMLLNDNLNQPPQNFESNVTLVYEINR